MWRRNRKTGNRKPETGNRKPETGNRKTGKPETGNRASVVAEGFHGVGPGGAAGGQDRGENGDTAEDGRHPKEGDRVDRCDAVEEPLEEAGEGAGQGQSEPDPRSGQKGRAAGHEAEDVARAGAQGDTDAELAGALGDVERQDAVYADRGEYEAQETEAADEHRGEPQREEFDPAISWSAPARSRATSGSRAATSRRSVRTMVPGSTLDGTRITCCPPYRCAAGKNAKTVGSSTL
jgi:hypothetical protein